LGCKEFGGDGIISLVGPKLTQLCNNIGRIGAWEEGTTQEQKNKKTTAKSSYYAHTILSQRRQGKSLFIN
jgi:hypothetical protein